MALTNARLFEAERKKFALLEALHRAALAVTKTATHERKLILRQILEEAVKLVGRKVNRGRIATYREENNQLVLESSWARGDTLGSTRHFGPGTLSLTDPPISHISVPLLVGDRVIGVLSLESDVGGQFDGNDMNTLMELAELAAIVLDRSQSTI